MGKIPARPTEVMFMDERLGPLYARLAGPVVEVPMCWICEGRAGLHLPWCPCWKP